MYKLAAVVMLLPGCYVGPVYKLKDAKQACANPLVERSYDLALKVDNGVGDGLFDYDVVGWTLLDHTNGQYDLKTGEFFWLNEFADGAIRRSEYAEGTGLIERNGDLDLSYALTATYTDETQAAFTVRHTRTGCSEVLRIENAADANDVELSDLTWSGGGLDWARNFVEGPSAVQAIGRMESDRSWQEYVDYSKGGVKVFWLTDGDGDGHQVRTFDDDDGFSKLEGSWERWYDGSVAMNFTRNNAAISKQTWDFSVDPTGSGGGSWSTNDNSCDINFNNGNCRLRNCTSESLDGPCEVPVTWPEY